LKILKRAALALLALALIGAVWLGVQLQRRPPTAPYNALVLPEAPRDAPLTVRFAGVATLLFDDGETAWMTDGFFSRPPLKQAMLGKLAPDEPAIERELARLQVARLAAVVPVHSHYDHAMDSPVVARRTGALLVGSATTLHIGRGLGLAEDRMREVKPGDTLQLGKFRLHFIESRHSPTPFTDGKTVQTLDAPLVPPARALAWREGRSWSILVEHASGRTMLVQGSAGFIPGALAGRRADTVFLGVGTRGARDEAYREAYWNEIVKPVGAKRVIPIHWDDFWQPIDRGLVPFPPPFDDFVLTMDSLQQRGARDGVQIRMAPLFVRFSP